MKKKIASVKAFYSYLKEEEMLDQNPFRKIKVKFKETIVFLELSIEKRESSCLIIYMDERTEKRNGIFDWNRRWLV